MISISENDRVSFIYLFNIQKGIKIKVLGTCVSKTKKMFSILSNVNSSSNCKVLRNFFLDNSKLIDFKILSKGKNQKKYYHLFENSQKKL